MCRPFVPQEGQTQALSPKMMTEGKPYFLSRPRRFGKSLLVSTLFRFEKRMAD